MGKREGFLGISGSAVLFFIALCLAAAPARAQTTVNANWIDTTGNWTTPSNWSCNCVPNNSPANVFNVTIPTGGVSLDATSSLASATINALSLGATLEIDNGESLSVTGNVDATHGVVNVDSAGSGSGLPGLSVGGNFTGGLSLGMFNIRQPPLATVSVAGAFTGSPSLYFYSTLQASSFTNTGYTRDYGGTIDVSGDLTNGEGDEMDMETSESPGSQVYLSVGGNLTNSGSIAMFGDPSITLTVGGNLTNSGTGDLEIPFGGTASVTGSTSNAGTITLANAEGNQDEMTSGSFSNAGTVNLGYGGNGNFLTVSSFSNTGTVNIFPSIDILPGGALFGSGAVLTVNSGGTYKQTAGSTEVDGMLMAPTVVISGGTLSVGSAASLSVGQGGTYTQTGGSTDVDGTLTAPSVRITGGTLSGSGTITGNIVNDATVSPGEPGDPATLTVNGNYTQNADGTLVIDIASATDFSILDVSGKAALDGIADFDFLNGYVPGANTDFAFLEAGSVAGDFSALDFTGINCPSCTFNLSTLSLDTGSTPPSFRAPTPEPRTLILFGTALLGLAALLRKKAAAAQERRPGLKNCGGPEGRASRAAGSNR